MSCLDLVDREKPNSENENDKQREPNAKTLAFCLQNASELDWQYFIPINIVTLTFEDVFKESTSNISLSISEIDTKTSVIKIATY